jgi:hypothetical protein
LGWANTGPLAGGCSAAIGASERASLVSNLRGLSCSSCGT